MFNISKFDGTELFTAPIESDAQKYLRENCSEMPTRIVNEIEKQSLGGSALNEWLGVKSVNIEAVLSALSEIDLIPKLDQWILINPKWALFKGTVEQITPVLLKKHPLFYMNTPFGIKL